MTMQRRDFLVGAGAALGVAAGARAAADPAVKTGAGAPELSTWAGVRDQFLLERDHVHMAMLLFASHPKPVRDAIDEHRRGFDANPVLYLLARKIVASDTPYAPSYARLTPSLLNTPEEVDRTVAAIAAL